MDWLRLSRWLVFAGSVVALALGLAFVLAPEAAAQDAVGGLVVHPVNGTVIAEGEPFEADVTAFDGGNQYAAHQGEDPPEWGFWAADFGEPGDRTPFCWDFTAQEWAVTTGGPLEPAGCRRNLTDGQGSEFWKANGVPVPPPPLVNESGLLDPEGEPVGGINVAVIGYVIDATFVLNDVVRFGNEPLTYDFAAWNALEGVRSDPVLTQASLAIDGWEEANTLYFLLMFVVFGVAAYFGWVGLMVPAVFGAVHAVTIEAGSSGWWSFEATALLMVVGLSLQLAMNWYRALKREDSETVR